DSAVALVRSQGLPFVLLQCTSTYPSTVGMVGLNVLDEFRRRYGCAVGLSDHSGVIYPSLAAATLGVDVIEVHVTLSRAMFGPDGAASLATADRRQLVEGVRYIEAMKAHPVDKDAVAAELAGMRQLFGKSVVARGDLPAGHPLAESDLALKKPGGGIPAQH